MATSPALQAAEAKLVPVAKDEFGKQLTACLTLVGGVGMSQDARREWLNAAWGTLRHMPADLLTIGCQAARLKAEHPSKIVPIIAHEVEALLAGRQRERARASDDLLALPAPSPASEYVTPDEMAAIKAEFGLPQTARGPVRKPGPARVPTEADYIEIMGEAAYRASIDAMNNPPVAQRPAPSLDNLSPEDREWVEAGGVDYERSVMEGFAHAPNRRVASR